MNLRALRLPLLRWRGRSQDAGDSDLPVESGLIDGSLADGRYLSRWMGWRLRALVVMALIGCVSIFFVARWLAAPAHLPGTWRVGPEGQLELAYSSDPSLREHEGRALIGMIGENGNVAVVDGLALQSASRWIIDDIDRERHRAMHEQLSAALSQGKVKLFFSEGEMVDMKLPERGLIGLGAVFWLLSLVALALYLLAMIVVLAKPSPRNLLYSVMTLCQAGNLAFMAVESTLELGLPPPFPRLDMPVRAAFDLITAAAGVHAATLHPRRLPGGWALSGLVWLSIGALIVMLSAGRLPGPWYWTQSAVALMSLAAVCLQGWSYSLEPHPYAMVMRRFGLMVAGTWLLLSVALLAADAMPSVQQQIVTFGPVIWYIFFASLLMMMPFLSKSQQVMREFSLLAAISTVTTSLDLLFVSVFSLGQFASLTIALFLSLGIYSGARQWLLNQLRGQNVMTTERMFEKLYRIAREVEVHPQRTSALLLQLLRELFEPLEASIVERANAQARVSGDGSALVVPVPEIGHEHAAALPGSIVIRFAHRGRRLFTSEDARLGDRIVEQLRRAIAFDQAVEQGRNEERLRLAQDLHDDIGARLLTLMYKAQSPEMEDYLRHTLQDLKTLTRGLAASTHPLSHAAAEWKADLTQRLSAAHMALGWNFSADCDLSLNVVQWSGLTRVMRELVNNVIAHSQARRVEIAFELSGDRLDLTVTDNGIGRNPRNWAHGLGLGGVRKRVKQLGGEVEWREVAPQGICCRVCIRQLSEGGQG